MWFIALHSNLFRIFVMSKRTNNNLKKWGQHLKLCNKDMTTISENSKYPEFKENYKNGSWITGHLVNVDGVYYHHSKRVVTAYEYNELPELLLNAVEEYNKQQIEFEERMKEVKMNLKASRALVEWAKNNAHRVERSNQSESEYYSVRHSDGHTYTVRVSGHRYPTGSMTDLLLGKIDTTDDCCERYCKMLGIEY